MASYSKVFFQRPAAAGGEWDEAMKVTGPPLAATVTEYNVLLKEGLHALVSDRLLTSKAGLNLDL